jgi:hypothetical protein
MQFFQAMNQILHPFLKPISYEIFFWVHLPPPGNKFFTVLRFLLKGMATNPLPLLQGS